MGQAIADLARCINECNAITVMLFDASGDSENVWIENDVLWRKLRLVHKQVVGALADCNLALERVGLALFIERHHDDGGAIKTHDARLFEKLFLAFLE